MPSKKQAIRKQLRRNRRNYLREKKAGDAAVIAGRRLLDLNPAADATGTRMAESFELRTRSGEALMPVARDRPAGKDFVILAIRSGEAAVSQWDCRALSCRGGAAGMVSLLRALPWRVSPAGKRAMAAAEGAARAAIGEAKKAAAVKLAAENGFPALAKAIERGETSPEMARQAIDERRDAMLERHDLL